MSAAAGKAGVAINPANPHTAPMPRVRSLGLVALGALLTLLLVAGVSAASGLFGGPDTETLEAPA